ncbi:hypothetical protein AAVH_34007 [Aphelenchoides avenae]|nr:hypothetical protein AAVH_34007 [Aphelenchus avenae]
MHFHVEQDREHALWPSFTLPCIQACEELIISGPHAVDFVLQSKAVEWLNGEGTKLLRWDLTDGPFDLQRNTSSTFDDFVDGLKNDFSAATEATQYEVIVVALHSVRPAFLETNGTTKERLASSERSTELHIKRELSSIPSSIN